MLDFSQLSQNNQNSSICTQQLNSPNRLWSDHGNPPSDAYARQLGLLKSQRCQEFRWRSPCQSNCGPGKLEASLALAEVLDLHPVPSCQPPTRPSAPPHCAIAAITVAVAFATVASAWSDPS